MAEPGSKTKLSKRKLDKYLKNRDFAQLMEHGQSIARRMGLAVNAETFNPVIVDFYEQVGYLPDALLNYLLLLGWSLDDKTEEFTREEMLRHFSLERVNKAPASFDCEKLVAFEARAMQRLPIKQRVAKVVPFLQRAKLVADPPPCDTAPYVTRILEAAGDRVKVAGDILDFDDFFVADDQLQFDETAFDKRLRKPTAARELLAKYRDTLVAAELFDCQAVGTDYARVRRSERHPRSAISCMPCGSRSRASPSASACSIRWPFSAGSGAWHGLAGHLKLPRKSVD